MFHHFARCAVAALALAGAAVAQQSTFQPNCTGNATGGAPPITPKVFILSMFRPEGTIWYTVDAFNLLAHNVSVPGLSPVFPNVHCTEDYEVCQLTTGEAEINAGTTMAALLFSPLFDLRRTYFLIGGIVGVNPRVASIGSVTFARYEIQVALQYEFDPRDLPGSFSTGYIPQGSKVPSMYPQTIYGTEVFELNLALRDIAIDIVRAANVTLNDTVEAAAYRELYLPSRAAANLNERDKQLFVAASRPPSIIACDGATADTYFTGTHLNQAFDNYTTLITNGTGVYCGSGQEDSATLEALLRATLAGRADFARVIAMRTASDYVAPPLGADSYTNLMEGPESAVESAVENIPIAAVPIIRGILSQWQGRFQEGIKPTNYIGDILGSLGNKEKMDFGPFMSNDNPIKRAEGLAGSMGSKRRRHTRLDARAALLPAMRLG